MTTFLIAVAQTAAVALIIVAVWQMVGMWPALLLIGVVVMLVATGLEHMTIDR